MADISLDEKRVYGEKTGAAELYVASDLGVTLVSVSADIVGEFTLAHRCTARDVAAGPESLAVATDEDVLVSREGGYAGSDFGPAVAVGFHEGDLLAAGEDGTVARRKGENWSALGDAGEVRAIDGSLVATAEGVVRAQGDGLTSAGLSDVRDVAAAGTPLAAAADGLYYLGPGWARAVEGAFEVVGSDGDRAHAATAEALYERGAEGEWREQTVPVDGALADVAHGEGIYAVTVDGTVLVDAGDGWRSRALGLRGVTGVAVAP